MGAVVTGDLDVSKDSDATVEGVGRRRGGAGWIVLRRLAYLPIVLLAVAALTFVLVAASPFDIRNSYERGEVALSDDTLAQITRTWDLDGPVHQQFGRWLGNVVQGDLGHSRLLGGQPVAEQIRLRAGPTLILVSGALVLILVGGLVAGVMAAAFRDGPVDWLVRTASFYTVASPSFWVGLLLLWVFAVQLGWFPPGGTADLRGSDLPLLTLRHLVLPVVALATTQFAWFAMFVRNQLLEVVREDYVRFAESQGLGRVPVLLRHALPNALLPFLTLVGAHLAELIGGAILIETVFGWPGLGSLSVEAARAVDLPLLLGVTLAGSVAIVLGNLVADLSYRIADPRIREGLR